MAYLQGDFSRKVGPSVGSMIRPLSPVFLPLAPVRLAYSTLQYLRHAESR